MLDRFVKKSKKKWSYRRREQGFERVVYGKNSRKNRRNRQVFRTRGLNNRVVIGIPDSFQPTDVTWLFTIGKKPECIVSSASYSKDTRENYELAAWNRYD